MESSYEEIETAVMKGHNVLITGRAGCGKSYVVKKLYQKLKNCGKVVFMTATTVCKTTNSFFFSFASFLVAIFVSFFCVLRHILFTIETTNQNLPIGAHAH